MSGEGFIPRHVVRQYALDEGLDPDELIRQVRRLDIAFVEHRREEREREREIEKRRQPKAHGRR